MQPNLFSRCGFCCLNIQPFLNSVWQSMLCYWTLLIMLGGLLGTSCSFNSYCNAFFFQASSKLGQQELFFFFLSLKVLQFSWSFYNCLELIFIMNSLRKSSCSYICAQWRMLVIKILLSLSCYGFTFAGSWMAVFLRVC